MEPGLYMFSNMDGKMILAYKTEVCEREQKRVPEGMFYLKFHFYEACLST